MDALPAPPPAVPAAPGEQGGVKGLWAMGALGRGPWLCPSQCPGVVTQGAGWQLLGAPAQAGLSAAQSPTAPLVLRGDGAGQPGEELDGLSPTRQNTGNRFSS